MGSLMGQILYDKMPVPSQLDETIPVEFDAWWARAASRNPEDRFQAAHEMSDALARALGIATLLTVPSLPPRSSSVPSIPPPNVTLKAVHGGTVGEMAVTQDGPVDSLASVAAYPDSKAAGEIDVRASGEFAAGTARRDYTPDGQPATRNVTVVSSRRMWAAIHAKRNATLYAVLGVLLLLIVTAIAFVSTRGSETEASPPAADVTLTPTREPVGADGTEAEPSAPEAEADPDAPDLVRPDDLEIEKPPEKAAPKGAPRRWHPPEKQTPAQPANPGGPDYGI
jgi:serine/threonine-protein kinase